MTRAPVRAPRGATLSCRGWAQEAAMRMLMNNLDPDVAERWQDLVVYGGSGKAARTWDDFDRIVATLRRLGGRRDAADPVRQARRRLPHARRRAARAHRQLDAGARVGRLGALPEVRGDGAHDVRPDDGRLVDLHRHPGDPPGHVRDVRARARRSTSSGSLAGRLVLSAGLGGMGGAQPLAVTMNGGVGLFVEIDRERIERRLRLKYVDRMTDSLDEALALGGGRAEPARARCRSACTATRPRSIPSSRGATSASTW